ncbi:hypothetical protein BDN71DRAFT_1427252 [Pleurotus eryngii]|uniref:Uncharacterized protein n=1 Tax=Pleurotus eryngii TaxID=5323 RepID=A0A9P6A592_PLEER|nr:hypothetical protein BDN71DRAFT_1427252 [Pleurotus eryngii]
MLWQILAKNESKGGANWTQTYLARHGRRHLQAPLFIHHARRASFYIAVKYQEVQDCGIDQIQGYTVNVHPRTRIKISVQVSTPSSSKSSGPAYYSTKEKRCPPSEVKIQDLFKKSKGCVTSLKGWPGRSKLFVSASMRETMPASLEEILGTTVVVVRPVQTTTRNSVWQFPQVRSFSFPPQSPPASSSPPRNLMARPCVYETS